MYTLSDYLFMFSLLLLILSLFLNGVGRRGSGRQPEIENPSGNITDLQIEHDHPSVLDHQSPLFGRLLHSYLFWISLFGILVSIGISQF